MSAVRLLLLLAATTACAEGIHIAGRDYRQDHLQGTEGAKYRIVSAGGAVIYAKYQNARAYVLKEGVETAVEGLPDSSVWDILLDSSGMLWVGTHNGLYQYSISENKATKFSDGDINGLGAAVNGTVYVSDTTALFLIRGGSLHLVHNKIWKFAFTKEGHFFYVASFYDHLYRATGGPAGPSTPIAGYEGDIRMLELDRRDDVLYVCSTRGLYTVLPGRDAAERVEGVEGPVYGLGFSPNGDIYIGRETEITTLSFIFLATYIDNLYTKLEGKLETMNEEIADQVKKISMHVDGKMDQVEENISMHVDGKLDQVEKKISKKLSDFISQLSAAVEGLQKTMQTLRGEYSLLKEETEAKLDILERALLLPDSPPAAVQGQQD